MQCNEEFFNNSAIKRIQLSIEEETSELSSIFIDDLDRNEINEYYPPLGYLSPMNKDDDEDSIDGPDDRHYDEQEYPMIEVSSDEEEQGGQPIESLEAKLETYDCTCSLGEHKKCLDEFSSADILKHMSAGRNMKQIDRKKILYGMLRTTFVQKNDTYGSVTRQAAKHLEKNQYVAFRRNQYQLFRRPLCATGLCVAHGCSIKVIKNIKKELGSYEDPFSLKVPSDSRGGV